jgi:MarR family 2-MHQ and catechol resistance regulon transcriptional repressor
MICLRIIVRVTQTIDPKRTIKDPRTEAILADFRATMAELKCVGSERLLRHGVSMTQLHILHMLDRHGQMAMSRLAEVLDVSDSNATGLVDRMEERGLIARTRVPEDRRVVLVEISPTGKAMLGDAEALRDDVMRRVLGRIERTHLDDVACAMTDLRAAIEAEATDPASTIHAHQHTRRD